MMVIPLMSCSARLPAYTLIIGALFPADEKFGLVSIGTLMLLGIYLVSTLLAILAAAVLGKTILKGSPRPLLLELPPYRLPSLKTVGMTLLERGKVFMSTAGTIILLMTVILWLMLHFPVNNELTRQFEARKVAAGDNLFQVSQLEREYRGLQLEQSYAGKMGGFLEPVLVPLGFDWKIGVGLIGAFAAREVFVSTMAVVYGVGEQEDAESYGLRQAMKDARRKDGSKLWTPLVGISLMAFFMIAMQCISTLAVARRETKSWKWPILMLLYLTTSAWLISLVIYQGGRLIGFN
jgi:ferrous iron transport protein B